MYRHLDTSDPSQFKMRERPHSEIFIPNRSSSSPLYTLRNSPLTPTFNREIGPPKLLKQVFRAYSLPSSIANPRRGCIMEVDIIQQPQLPALTPKDLIDYFNNLNDLRSNPETRSLPEQYRFIYPPSLLDPSEITSLQAHITHPLVRPLWLRWIGEVRDLINEWERAVGMMGREVGAYLALTENEKLAYKSIDDLNTSSTQGVNQFIELHLERAIQIVKAPRKGNTINTSKFPELAVEFENLKVKYENLHVERRKWTRLKLGYNY
ncbi:hypothetical protein BGX38DRAFT_318010 [Terfezia claveryi]|nr:hypothetical protein BGX38DRAFT_318010 [Terfezia claveryi]